MPEQRELAAQALTLFLGQQGCQAQGTLAELTDEEAAEIAAAAADRHTARDQIKAVLSRAYDRRRQSAALEARQREIRLRRSAQALAVLQEVRGLSADASAAFLAGLSDEEITALIAEDEATALEAVPAQPVISQ